MEGERNRFAPTRKDMQSWLFCMNEEEVSEALGSLTLTKQGGRFAHLERLEKWLQGNYSAADFERCEDWDETTARIKRESIRKSYIETTCMERSGSTIFEDNYDKEAPHPLSLYINESVQSVTDGSTQLQWPTPVHNESTTAEVPVRTAPPRTDSNEAAGMSVSQADIQSIWKSFDNFANSTDKMMSMMCAQMEKMTIEISSLKASRAPVSSTRIEETSGSITMDPRNVSTSQGATSRREEGLQDSRPRVGFQDTFTLIGPRNSSPNDSRGFYNETLPTPQTQANLFNRLEGSWRGGNENSAGMRNTSNTLNNDRTSLRDVGQIVSRWNIHFSGDPSENVDVFLRKMDEGRRAANLSESDMLASLSLLFKGVADLWYSSHKEAWNTYEQFYQAAKQRWGTKRDLQDRLRYEATHRYQQAEEPARIYITCLESMVRKFEPRLSMDKQLDMLHENLLPELKRIIRREDCNTVDDLIDRAVKGEITLEKEKSDRTPIPPCSSVMPEAYYQPAVGSKPPKVVGPTIAATYTTAVKESPPDRMEAMFKAMMGQLLEKIEKLVPKPPNKPYGGRKSSSPPRKQQGMQRSRSGSQAKVTPKKDAPKERSKGSRSPSPKQGLKQPFKCYGCGRPNVIRRECPNCSGNEQKGA